MQGDEGIWAHLLRGKYLKNKSLLEVITSKGRASSSVWKGILHGVRAIARGVKWRVGDGQAILFWTDSWVGDIGPLLQFASMDHEGINVDLKVNHFMTNTDWNTQRLAALLSYHIILRITSMHTSFAGNKVDKMIWAWSKDGYFSVKSTYWGLDNCGLSSWGWSFIWSFKIPPKIKFFLWTLLHNKLMTNQQRVVKGLCIEEDCSKCSGTMEGLDHLFRGCPETVLVWESIYNKSSKFGLPNMIVFVISLWCIWKWHCSRIFYSNFKTPPLPYLFITGFGRACWKAINDGGLAKDDIFNLIVLKPPPFGLVKLNVDGSVCSGLNLVAAGGVIRDCNKAWLGGFAINKGIVSILEAELWGLLEGLKFA
ncbi:hypothetical protein ACOSP7_004808 [Xanthoceras sorbifolium]